MKIWKDDRFYALLIGLGLIGVVILLGLYPDETGQLILSLIGLILIGIPVCAFIYLMAELIVSLLKDYVFKRRGVEK